MQQNRLADDFVQLVELDDGRFVAAGIGARERDVRGATAFRLLLRSAASTLSRAVLVQSSRCSVWPPIVSTLTAMSGRMTMSL